MPLSRPPFRPRAVVACPLMPLVFRLPAWLRPARRLGAVVALVTVAACQAPSQQAPSGAVPLSPVQTPAAAIPTPAPPPVPMPAADGRVKVGLLLPLSGANQAMGEAMLAAAELALFDVGEPSLELLPRDTGDSADGARRAADDALAAGAEVLVGPFGAGAVRAVAPLAAVRRTPVLAFSTDRAVAGNGVWLMGFMPDEQISRVVRYAAAQGLKRHAALVPETAYGTMVLSAWRQALAAGGATGERVQRSEDKGPNVEPVRRLVADDAPYDALLLPEGGVRLRQLAPLLGYFELDLTRVRLLGTAQWDEPGVGRVPQLVGGWFAGPPPQAWDSFARRWQDAFARSQPPARFAALAYDAVALAATQARLPAGTRFTPDALANPSGFAGANGIFRFGRDGVPEHALAILQVTAEGNIVLDPAAESFTAAPGL